ncbi:hypothetical protein A1QO_03925 [Vibrio genomosp. F10 str. ZF-129]|uniref:Uncharacterized protein n=1 Tax=Vibrio genomosp. F10 str. ZF-129 TaxID=1187848 RepID=A0A1E5BII9_9VIBR|nr:hypothetical protein A1QO_03925 [Vibrio genomosp. F10 str. ZF-129]
MNTGIQIVMNSFDKFFPFSQFDTEEALISHSISTLAKVSRVRRVASNEELRETIETDLEFAMIIGAPLEEYQHFVLALFGWACMNQSFNFRKDFYHVDTSLLIRGISSDTSTVVHNFTSYSKRWIQCT